MATSVNRVGNFSRTVNEGSTVIMKCTGGGHPVPEMTWENGSSTLTNTSQVTIITIPHPIPGANGAYFTTSTLRIHAASRYDARRYRCHANSTKYDTTSRFNFTTWSLTVRCKLHILPGKWGDNLVNLKKLKSGCDKIVE